MFFSVSSVSSVSSVFSVDPLFFIRVDSCAFVVLTQQNVTKRGTILFSYDSFVEESRVVG